MVTRRPGGYTYPETVGAERQTQPELFTGWAFVLNHPDLCEVPHQCGSGDFNDEVKLGVYDFAGVIDQLSACFRRGLPIARRIGDRLLPEG